MAESSFRASDIDDGCIFVEKGSDKEDSEELDDDLLAQSYRDTTVQGSEADDEEDDNSLTISYKSSRCSACNCCSTKRCIVIGVGCLLCFVIVLVMVSGGVVGLYETGNLPVIDSKATKAIIQGGDYVQLPYRFNDEDGSTQYVYSLLFTSPTNVSNYSATVYIDVCSLNATAFIPILELMPPLHSLNFTNCPDQTCFFDTYVYEVPSNESVIIYNITNNDYVPIQPNEFEILAFDDIKQSSNSYIAPSPQRAPIKTVPMRSRNTVFTLNSEEIKKSSYYFFAIKLVKGSFADVNRFTINRSGIQAVYNSSRVPPFCTLNTNSSCSITVESSDYCIYLLTETPDNPHQVSSVKLFEKHTLRRKVIYLATGSLISFIAVVTVMVLFVSGYRKWRKKSPHQINQGYHVLDETHDHEIDRKRRPACMDRYKTICFNERGLFYHFDQCGVTIDIPEGAVHGPATLEFGTSRMFPGFSTGNVSYEPISSFIWIHVDTDLAKPAKVYIPHWIQYDETNAEEVFLLVNHDKDDNAIFHVKEDSNLQLMNSVGCVEMTSFCSACLAAIKNDGKPLKHRYHVEVFERSSIDQSEKDVHICLLYKLECATEIEKKYKQDGFAPTGFKKLKGGISPEGITTTNDLPTTDQHWKHVQIGTTDKIEESDINIYDVLNISQDKVDDETSKDLEMYEERGLYPPRFKLRFYTATNQSVTKHSVKITLHGFEGDSFSVTITLGYFSLDHEHQELEKDAVFINLLPFLEPAFIDSNSYFNFGHQLGLSVDTMSEIEAKYPLDYGKCTEQILLKWRRKSPSSTYTDVTNALKRCGYPVLAHYIVKKLNIREELPSDFVNVSSPNDDDLVAIWELLPINKGSRVLKSEPSISDLSVVVYPHISNKWKEFGNRLGLTIPELETIEKDHKYASRDCFIELFHTIQRNDRTITWEIVLKALYSPLMKAYRAIEEVYKHLQSK